MNWLAAIAAGISKALLEALAALAVWVIGKGVLLYLRLRRRSEIKKDAEKSMEPLKNAKTAKEIDDATKDALDGL